jgi:hypothetical protein
MLIDKENLKSKEQEAELSEFESCGQLKIQNCHAGNEPGSSRSLECSPSFDRLRTVSEVEPLGQPRLA